MGNVYVMIKFIGKVIFPELPPWQREQQMELLSWVAGVVLVSAIVAGLVLLV